MDISNPTNPSLAGFFDIFVANDSPDFNGAWSVYPFFSSGIAIVSGIEQGLYVLQPDLGVTPPDDPIFMHLESVDSTSSNRRGKFSASAEVTIHDAVEMPVVGACKSNSCKNSKRNV